MPEAEERKARFYNVDAGMARLAELKALRARMRTEYIAAGVLPDPDKPGVLAEAAQFRGTCMDMCPEYERLERETQKELDKLEMFPGTTTADPSATVKIYRRPAAGRELPLPDEVRPPEVLKRTLDYLFHTLLPEQPDDPAFAKVQAFLWNRTRAIRQDFIVQSERGLIAIECHERIARYHILCLHWKGGVGAEGWSEQQELEQLRKTLRSLMEYYDDYRIHGTCPHEAEFRAYNLLLHIRDAETLREVEMLPTPIFQAEPVQMAMKLRMLVQRSNMLEKRGAPSNTEATPNYFTRFFSELRRANVGYLMACLAENIFPSVRIGAVKALARAYMVQHTPLPIDFCTRILGMDSDDETCEFLHTLGVDASDTARINRSIVLDEDKTFVPPFSKSIVEVKRGSVSCQAIVDGGVQPARPAMSQQPIINMPVQTTSTFVPQKAKPAVEAPKAAPSFVAPSFAAPQSHVHSLSPAQPAFKPSRPIPSFTFGNSFAQAQDLAAQAERLAYFGIDEDEFERTLPNCGSLSVIEDGAGDHVGLVVIEWGDGTADKLAQAVEAVNTSEYIPRLLFVGWQEINGAHELAARHSPRSGWANISTLTLVNDPEGQFDDCIQDVIRTIAWNVPQEHSADVVGAPLWETLFLTVDECIRITSNRNADAAVTAFTTLSALANLAIRFVAVDPEDALLPSVKAPTRIHGTAHNMLFSLAIEQLGDPAWRNDPTIILLRANLVRQSAVTFPLAHYLQVLVRTACQRIGTNCHAPKTEDVTKLRAFCDQLVAELSLKESTVSKKRSFEHVPVNVIQPPAKRQKDARSTDLRPISSMERLRSLVMPVPRAPDWRAAAVRRDEGDDAQDYGKFSTVDWVVDGRRERARAMRQDDRMHRLAEQFQEQQGPAWRYIDAAVSILPYSGRVQLSLRWLSAKFAPILSTLSTPLTLATENSVIVLVGVLIGINMAVISVVTEWASDLRRGYCSSGWWLNEKFCCWELTDPEGPGGADIPKSIAAAALAAANSTVPNTSTLIARLMPFAREIPEAAPELTGSCAEWVPWSETAFFSWFLYVVISGVFASVCALLVKTFAPYAAGSGISEIKCVIGGFIINGFLSPWTLVIKSLGLPLAIASGLSVGKEGPAVHVACCMGNVVAQALRPLVRSQAKFREMLTAASAAGVAVAFGSPIGGVLFALEEVTTHFPPLTMWRTFLCALASTVALSFMNPFRTGKLVMFQVEYSRNWHFFELIFHVIIGIFGGLYGEYVVRYNLQVQRFRRKKLASFGIAEALVLAVLTAAISYTNRFLRLDMTEALEILFRQCEGDDSELCQSRYQWEIALSLLVATALRFVLVVLSYGCKVPAGIFIPSMAVGATFGRMVGILVKALQTAHPKWQLFAACTPDVPCITPGTYAVLGAAAALAGVTRITVAVVVIMFELTGALTYILPIMVVVGTAKMVADLKGRGGISDRLIKFNGYPFLDDEDHVFGIAVGAMMKTAPLVLYADGMTLEEVESLLDQGDFKGFPVVQNKDDDTLAGYITRLELRYAMSKAHKAQLLSSGTICLFAPHTTTHDDFELDQSYHEDEFEAPGSPGGHVDFGAWVDPTPLTVQPQLDLEVVTEMFKKMGPRVILVTHVGKLLGIVTIKDLLRHMTLSEKEAEASDAREAPEGFAVGTGRLERLLEHIWNTGERYLSRRPSRAASDYVPLRSMLYDSEQT
ncbi:glycerol ethanol, ferric requiring protein [Malassezia cuniculi]|uniref:Chloride channel protein n=1 Tax=Malassezia cuniculi TaxID=948313 RepID=A0AAF0JCT6_9BASI|nr:glycerol ethanol, ferric requiring protein [Malassezia cuniculi]